MAGVARGAHVLARDARPTARQELFARGLIWLHVVGILASLVLWVMFHRGPVRMTWFELSSRSSTCPSPDRRCRSCCWR